MSQKHSSHWLRVSSLSCIGIFVHTWYCKGTENHVTLACFPPPSWRLHLRNRPWNWLREDIMYTFIHFYQKHTHKSIKSVLIQQDRASDIQNKTQWSCAMEVLHMTQTDRTWPDCMSLDLSDPLWEHSDPFASRPWCANSTPLPRHWVCVFFHLRRGIIRKSSWKPSEIHMASRDQQHVWIQMIPTKKAFLVGVHLFFLTFSFSPRLL